MPTLKKRQLEQYLRQRFGPGTELLSYGRIGQESSESDLKGFGYGKPIRVAYRSGGQVRSVVLSTMSPGPFGHEHPADRAQAMLMDYDTYGKLPRHVRSVDVGAFAGDGSLFSVAQAREFFVLIEWVKGDSYHVDFERLLAGGRLRTLDRHRAGAMARYLVSIHRVKHRDPALYRRRLRELIGHGECIMGLTDSYPDRYRFIDETLLRSIEEACNRWRWRLRSRAARLAQVHGDFHPWNILFRAGTDFSVLDRSRGEWGEPADDLTSLSINYLFFSLQRCGRLAGPFEVLFRHFWDTYLEASRDHQILETTAPFFAFRGLVIASPLWYPNLTISVRRTIFRFVQNVLAAERFDPAMVNRYCLE